MIQENISSIIIVLSAVLAVTVALVAYLYWRLRRAESEYEFLARGTQGLNLVEIVNDNIARTGELLAEVDDLSELYGSVIRRLAGAVQHVGIVRFDAFRDIGGLMSFSLALLDDRGNGMVLTTIYGRTESRTYAKPVVERASSYELSPEEREAIRLAMQSKEKGALPVVSRDREHEEKIATLRLFHDKDTRPAPAQERSTRVEGRPEAGTVRLRQAEREEGPRVRPGGEPGEAPGGEPSRRSAGRPDIAEPEGSGTRRKGRAGAGRGPEADDEREQQLARKRLEQALEQRDSDMGGGERGEAPDEGEGLSQDSGSRGRQGGRVPQSKRLDTPLRRLRGRKHEGE